MVTGLLPIVCTMCAICVLGALSVLSAYLTKTLIADETPGDNKMAWDGIDNIGNLAPTAVASVMHRGAPALRRITPASVS